jgi:anti-anti-sigma regulatory factor
MTTFVSDPFEAVIELSVRRLGERTCVINVGSALRHVQLPVVEEAVRGATRDGIGDIVFDLTYLRHYETFALVRLAREWDTLMAAGCAVHVSARESRVLRDLERLAGPGGWRLHSSTVSALRALLSAPVA